MTYECTLVVQLLSCPTKQYPIFHFLKRKSYILKSIKEIQKSWENTLQSSYKSLFFEKVMIHKFLYLKICEMSLLRMCMRISYSRGAGFRIQRPPRKIM